MTADVVVIGGGVMGSACAWVLAEAGRSVVVLEKSIPGAEASSAAAGILGAGAEAHGPGPLAELLGAGLPRHAAWARRLGRQTGIDVEFREGGVLRVAETAASLRALAKETAWMEGTGRKRRVLSAAEVRKLEPALAKSPGGVFFPEDARIDPKKFFRAVHVAAERAGARFESGAYVKEILTENDRAVGVAVESGTVYRGKTVVLAAGSWSTLVPGAKLPEDAVIPARGQVVELELPRPVLSRVVAGPRCYLVPRDDGRILVGATVEFVGYRREVTARGIRDLLDAAVTLVPALGDATFGASWSSFRPYTADELPLLGRSAVPGLLLATGHYRNGILLAPITAEIIRAIVLGKSPPLPVDPYAAKRLETAENRAPLRARRNRD